jgi:hypothetical protein
MYRNDVKAYTRLAVDPRKIPAFNIIVRYIVAEGTPNKMIFDKPNITKNNAKGFTNLTDGGVILTIIILPRSCLFYGID